MSELVYINFEEEGFSEEQAVTCHLYMLRNGAHSKLAVLDGNGKLKVLREWNGESADNRTKDLLLWEYEQRALLLPHSQLQFIPNDLYDESQTDLYNAFFIDNYPETASVYHFKYIPAKFICTFDERNTGLTEKLGETTLIPAAAPWIESLALIGAHEKALLGIQLHTDEAEFTYFNAGKLIFYNRFPKTDADEFNYFLLSILAEFEVDAEKTIFVLSGEITAGDVYYERVNKYGRHVRMAPVKGLLETDAEMVLTQGHRLLNLFGTTLCVL